MPKRKHLDDSLDYTAKEEDSEQEFSALDESSSDDSEDVRSVSTTCMIFSNMAEGI